jgi:hypothetical protein
MTPLKPFHVCHIHFPSKPRLDVFVQVPTTATTKLEDVHRIAKQIAYSANRPLATSVRQIQVFTIRDVPELSIALRSFKEANGFNPRVLFHYAKLNDLTTSNSM